MRISPVILLFASLLAIPAGLCGQDDIQQAEKEEMPQKYTRALMTNPLTTLWGTVPLTAEYRLCYLFINSQKQASELSFSYLGRGPLLGILEQDSVYQNRDIHFIVRGFRFQAEQKFYIPALSNQLISDGDYAPFGIYIAPHLSYASVKFSSKYFNLYDIYIAVSQFNVNMKAGMQFRILGRFTADFFGGLGYKNNVWAQHYSSTNIQRLDLDEIPGFYKGHLKIMLGFNAGILF